MKKVRGWGWVRRGLLGMVIGTGLIVAGLVYVSLLSLVSISSSGAFKHFALAGPMGVLMIVGWGFVFISSFLIWTAPVDIGARVSSLKISTAKISAFVATFALLAVPGVGAIAWTFAQHAWLHPDDFSWARRALIMNCACALVFLGSFLGAVATHFQRKSLASNATVFRAVTVIVTLAELLGANAWLGLQSEAIEVQLLLAVGDMGLLILLKIWFLILALLVRNAIPVESRLD